MILNLLEHLLDGIGLDFVILNLTLKLSKSADFSETCFLKGME